MYNIQSDRKHWTRRSANIDVKKGRKKKSFDVKNTVKSGLSPAASGRPSLRLLCFGWRRLLRPLCRASLRTSSSRSRWSSRTWERKEGKVWPTTFWREQKDAGVVCRASAPLSHVFIRDIGLHPAHLLRFLLCLLFVLRIHQDHQFLGEVK